MTTSARGVAFIATREGFSSRVYRDAVGVPTIGYGHTGPDVWRLQPLSRVAGLALLRRDLARHYEPPVRALGLPLNQNQFDALVSFVYNLGPGYLAPGHTMGDALRRHDWQAAADAFLLYDRAGGHVLLGLERRREAERAMFLAPAGPPVDPRLVRLRVELAKRRRQLRGHPPHPGTRRYLRRRVHELEHAIHSYERSHR